MNKSMLVVAGALVLGVLGAPTAARANVTCSIVEIEASSGSAPAIRSPARCPWPMPRS